MTTCARTPSPRASDPPTRSWRWPERGQSLVELALTLPILMLLALGFTEGAFALTDKAAQDRGTATVADWMAGHPEDDDGWYTVADTVLPTDCDVTVTWSEDPPDLVTIEASCPYHPRLLPGLWPELALTSSESSAMTPSPTASPSPEPSASVSP